MDVYVKPEDIPRKLNVKNYDQYVDIMNKALHTNIQNNIFPYWRNHNSLKGWSGMNYPSVLVNFHNRKKEDFYSKKFEFSNTKRPISSSIPTSIRPLSSVSSEIYQKMNNDPEYNAQAHDKMKNKNSAQYVSIGQGNFNTEKKVEKYSAGTLATNTYGEKADTILKLNPKIEDFAVIKPVYAILGPDKDPLFSRKVKQLDDVDFNDEESNELEENYNYKRLPKTILTESSLKQNLSINLQALNLERHTWISDDFIGKMGFLAPNIKELGLRGIEVSDDTVEKLCKSCNILEKIDISECHKLSEKSIASIVQYTTKLRILKAAFCKSCINDKTLKYISTLDNLSVLDVSYCSNVTDEGLMHFTSSKSIFYELYLNGLENISSVGATAIMNKSLKRLTVLEIASGNPEKYKTEFCETMSLCPLLEVLDISGMSNVNDEGLTFFYQMSKEREKAKEICTFENLREIKFNLLDKITDDALLKIVAKNKKIDTLELIKCTNLTEVGILAVVKSLVCLKKINLNLIPDISPETLEDIKKVKPNIVIIRFDTKPANPKDNGLRVPLPPIEKKKKKKKGKKGKKKK